MFSKVSTRLVRGELGTYYVAQNKLFSCRRPWFKGLERKWFHLDAISLATQRSFCSVNYNDWSWLQLQPPRNVANEPIHGRQHTTHYYQQQKRWVTSKKRARQALRDKGKDAFLTLGVSRKDSYAHVKKTFLRIAMTHHPDTHAADTPEKAKEHREKFMTARSAFEAIVSGPDGMAILKSESDKYEVEDDLDTWFKTETGYDMPFMDARTMREVAEMTETSAIGLDRDGGMWTLAKMVAQSVKDGGDGRDMLRLEAGVVRDRNIDGILRRRRKR